MMEAHVVSNETNSRDTTAADGAKVRHVHVPWEVQAERGRLVGYLGLRAKAKGLYVVRTWKETCGRSRFLYTHRAPRCGRPFPSSCCGWHLLAVGAANTPAPLSQGALALLCALRAAAAELLRWWPARVRSSGCSRGTCPQTARSR
jgi:hypothetical protein